MSGGFFRGTSADQDTRFSNKQAKLLKSQKFAAELDQPVDMTKIKMDVIRPWIATRATELLGFEDEVLINFVYGLLDGKEVDGKQIQIQLTGFLEKNTGKFMKELWGLLLSAQNNASGVPQQFLDAKEEEMKKKKVESDRITQEIQKRKEKEGREFEQEKQKRMDVEAGNSRYPNAVSASSSRHSLPWDSRVQSEKERDMEPVHSPRLKGRRTSPSRSFCTYPSKSGNSKEGDSRSASLSSQSRGRSISPSKRYHSPSRHSVSSERRHRSHVQRSISPLHKYSPRNNWSRHSRHESPYARRRSHSTPRHRSPSPIRRRSPYGRRSPSSLRHRSPPSHHRSPALNRRRSPSPGRQRQSPSLGRRRRSPSPGRRRSSPSLARRRWSPSLVRRRRSPSPRRGKRSPSPRRRRRSPSPGRRRRSPSPGRRRRSLSPGHRRRSPSPLRHKRSPSPAHRRISLSPDRRSPSPLPSRTAAPARNRSPPLQRRISPSPSQRRSPTRLSVSPVRHRSVSPPPRQSPLDRSPQEQVRPLHSPRYHAADSQISPRARKRSHSPYSSSPSNPTLGDSNRVQTRSNGFESKKNQNKYAYERAHEKRSSVRDALHREVTELSDLKTVGHAPHQLPSFSRSVSRDSRDNDNHGKDAGAMSDNSSERSSSPGYLTRSPLRRNRLPEITVKQTEKRIPGDISGMNGDNKQATNIRERAYHKTDPSSKKGTDGQPSNASSDEEIGHKIDMDLPKRNAQGSGSLNDREYGAGRVHDEKNYVDYSRQQFFHSASDVELQPDSRNDANRDSHYLPESVKKSKRKMDTSNQVDNFHSDSEETDAHKHRNKEKRRHKHRRDSVDTSASDSDAEDRREAKRRKKDERRLRKEEKRRKREEKHRKRLERHRGKQQLKSIDTVTPPSDFEMDGVSSKKRSDALEAESEEKRLEIELRERALESLRARKAVGH